jgi:hypothetical protein
MKTAKIAVALLLSLSATAAFARAGGPEYPVCFQAARAATAAIDARNHGFTRADARRGEFIPSAFVPGHTPQWVVEMIDPYLNAAYAVPASQQVDADAEAAKVFGECKARVASGI